MSRSLLPVILVVAALDGAVASFTAPPPADLATPVVVARAPSAASWLALLRASGAAARTGSAADIGRRGAGVVPADAPLTPAERAELAAGVRAGARLVVAHAGLAAAVGFERGRPRTVRTLSMRGLTGVARLPGPLVVRPLLRSGGRPTPLAQSGDAVILASAPVGAGAVLASAVDPYTGGWSPETSLPLLGRMAARFLRAPAGPERDAIEVYLDPGHSKGSPEELAAALAPARVVHVAGWNAGYADPSFDYPYGRLLDALHAQGTHVYAWLEPPFVTERLWSEHPECRERDQAGADALDDWRKLFALEDDGCFELAWSLWADVLTRFPWDGVNIAELYWASTSVPAHPSALERFGSDPRGRPGAWLAFRRELVASLTRKIVDRVRGLARPLDVIVTTIDDSLDPDLAQRIGIDLDLAAQVARATGATLQVEDPYTVWTMGPARYTLLDQRLAALGGTVPAYVDVNVVPRAYARPTATMTGAELDLSIANAGRSSGRIALYSEATLLAGDLERSPAALAATATTADGWIRSPWTLTVRAPSETRARLVVDGRPWPTVDGRAIIPAGRHRIGWVEGRDDGPALRRLTAELLAQERLGSGLTFTYASRLPAYAVVDRAPLAVSIDGSDVPGEQDDPVGTVIRLPAGRHQVRLLIGDR